MRYFLVLLFFQPFHLFSQHITLSGAVYGWELREENRTERKLFYAFDDQRFEGEKYVTITADNKFHWSMDIKLITTSNIKHVTFSSDTLIKLPNRHACVQQVNLNNIITKIGASKDIEINCDLLLTFSCESAVGATSTNQKFVGRYKLSDSTSTRYVSLDEFFDRYTSNLAGINTEIFTEEYGSWRYNSTKNTLTFGVNFLRNKQFGLFKLERKRYEFEVIQTENGLEFKSETYQLVKLN